jgi:hypothetical protein
MVANATIATREKGALQVQEKQPVESMRLEDPRRLLPEVWL